MTCNQITSESLQAQQDAINAERAKAADQMKKKLKPMTMSKNIFVFNKD